jgi:polysaccharide chain length determinant protein (PEP-CTERM system associated)
MTSDPIPSPSDESLLLQAADVIRRRWLMAAVVFTTVMATCLSLALFLPDLFRASSVVLVERQLPDTMARSAPGGELESRLHVIQQEVLSRANLTGLIERFNLYPSLRTHGDIDSALEQLRSDIKIELTGPEQVSGRSKTVAFRLTVTGENPQTVAEVTNAVAAFYVAQNNQIRSEEASRTALFLKAQLDEASRQLTSRERDVATYTTRHAGGLPQQAEMYLAALERLNTQLRLNGERLLRALDQRASLLSEMPPGSTLPVGDIESAAARRLSQLRRDLAQWEGFPERNPDVKRIKEEIAVLESQAPPAERGAGDSANTVRPGTRTLEGLNTEIERLRQEEISLRQLISAAEKRLEDVPYRENELALIMRDRQAAKDLYDSLLKRYEDAQFTQSMEAANQGERFRILEAAIPPMGPNAPNRLRLLLMGLLLAALLSSIAVLGREQLDTSFHSVDQVRGFTRVPVLASIPSIGMPVAKRLPVALGVTACLVGALALVAALSAYVATGNEQLARFFVRGA